ncbi:hypothetical protein BDF20DRAFT_842705 [Mycotypha africana]|uniref:uncharacterized protein n=1 Tax=Mycotypha africana TaxID=64632 RepID=UPI002300AC35|nr:uncharacterized protein BDF20DRAFT_842705 [Mycotypha africana]KAI8991108.1 hypothetical protein BDF20DRAFT_842705 [Mycotypha africana]
MDAENATVAALQAIESLKLQLLQTACTKSSSISTLAFLKGFIVGQLSVIFVVALVLRYLFTEGVQREKRHYVPYASRAAAAKTQQSCISNASIPLPKDHITIKTYYDMNLHPPESTDWLNVLLAQAILQYREDAKINNRLIMAVDHILNGGVKPSFLGPIQVTELNLGEEFPIFSNARIRRSDEVDSMKAEIDFEYNDQITLGIETQIILNWPKPAFAALPISLVLSVVRFSGTLTIELINPPPTTTPTKTPLQRYIAISSHSDFILDLDVQSSIGSRTKLEDIPKLRDLIQTKLRNVYIDKLVYPTFVKIKVPNLWKDNATTTTTPTTTTTTTHADSFTTTTKETLTTALNSTRENNEDMLQPAAAEKLEELVEDIKEA